MTCQWKRSTLDQGWREILPACGCFSIKTLWDNSSWATKPRAGALSCPRAGGWPCLGGSGPLWCHLYLMSCVQRWLHPCRAWSSGSACAAVEVFLKPVTAVCIKYPVGYGLVVQGSARTVLWGGEVNLIQAEESLRNLLEVGRGGLC